MIKITVEDIRGFSQLQQRIRQIPKLFEEAAVDAYKVGEPIYDTLITPPPERSWPGDYPLEWTSLRQKRAVKAKLRREGNYPYVRRHEIRQSWFYVYRFENNAATYELGNTDPRGQWLYGSLDREMPGMHQQRFHALTGWPRGYDKVLELDEAVRLAIVRGLDERLAGGNLWTSITRRAERTAQTVRSALSRLVGR